MEARILEGPQCLAQNQILTGELFALGLFQICSRRQLLPDHLRLRLPVPRIKDVGDGQVIHPLEVESRQVEGGGERLGQRRLAAAARPLNEQWLAAAQRMPEVSEQS